MSQLELIPLPATPPRAESMARVPVITAAQARELYLAVLHEPATAERPAVMSNLEAIVRSHVRLAREGDARAREQIFDRLWGKEMGAQAQSEGQENDAALLSDNELARIIAGKDD